MPSPSNAPERRKWFSKSRSRRWRPNVVRLLLGPPQRSPQCPLRAHVIGGYEPDAERKLRNAILGSVGIGLITFGVVVYHHQLMFIMDVIISLCT